MLCRILTYNICSGQVYYLVLRLMSRDMLSETFDYLPWILPLGMETESKEDATGN